MESQPHMQFEFTNCIPMVIDGIPSQPSPESHLFLSQPLPESQLQNTLFHQNTQNDSILELGQSLKDINAQKTVGYEYDGLIDRGNFCLGGASFDSGSPSTNLACSNGLNDDANNSVITIQRVVPPESLMFPGGCSYAPSSSIPTTLSCGYDGPTGGFNDKWDLDRFLMQQEMNRRASTSGLEPTQFNENQYMNNEWVFPSSSSVGSSYAFGTSRSNSGLCLSLATCAPSIPSNLSCTGVIQNPSQTRLGSEYNCHRMKEHSHGCTSNNRSVMFPPVISDSQYLSVLQEILSEISSFSLDSLDKTSYKGGNLASSSSNFPVPSNHFFDTEYSCKDTSELYDDNGSYEVPAGSSKKSQMLALLQMVDNHYNRCLDEIHMVISAFHAATELDPQLHSRFALQTISFFYKNLRERISNHILSMGMDDGSAKDSCGRSVDKSFIQKQWTIQQLKRKDQLWRPQRGLPERSVSVLRAWMFDNFLHPYPKDAEKHLLAVKSGLTRSQVSNWFINARVRLWKPLVEEMCAEVNRRKCRRQNDEGINESNTSKTQLCIYDYNQRSSH